MQLMFIIIGDGEVIAQISSFDKYISVNTKRYVARWNMYSAGYAILK